MNRYLTPEDKAALRRRELARWYGGIAHLSPIELSDMIHNGPRPQFDPLAEALMREVRVRLGQAHLCERRGEIDLADAYGAVAGNKMARAYRIASNVVSIK